MEIWRQSFCVWKSFLMGRGSPSTIYDCSSKIRCKTSAVHIVCSHPLNCFIGYKRIRSDIRMYFHSEILHRHVSALFSILFIFFFFEDDVLCASESTSCGSSWDISGLFAGLPTYYWRGMNFYMYFSLYSNVQVIDTSCRIMQCVQTNTRTGVRWTIVLRNWNSVQNRFSYEFPAT